MLLLRVNLLKTLLYQFNEYIKCELSVARLFTDITKAFDSAEHSLLLSRLWESENGIAHLWFEIYLTRKSQCVKMKDSISFLLPITCEVPQSSVLGQIFFNIFKKNFVLGNFNDTVFCFADNTGLCYSTSNPTILRNKTPENLFK